MPTKRSYNIKIDWWSILIYFALIIVGFLSIHSASYNETLGFGLNQRSGMQLVWMSVSIFIGIIILFINKEFFYKITVPLYVLSIIVHILLIFFGKEVNGSKSWIGIGSFGIQPAEFGKMITALMLARVVSDFDFNINSLRGIIQSLTIMILPMAIIVLQNDTGSALVYGSFIIALYLCGLNVLFFRLLFTCIILFIVTLLLKQDIILWCLFAFILVYQAFKNRNYFEAIKYFGITLLVYMLAILMCWSMNIDISKTYLTLISMAITLIFPIRYAIYNKGVKVYGHIIYFALCCTYMEIVHFIFDNILKLHQQKRILDLLGLESDLKGWGYNVNQSMIAIGSGGLMGKGYMNGTQTKYNFVPEQATDFIFCTIGEEGGFIMTSIILLLFSTLIFRLLKIANKANDEFAKIYTYGVISILTIHVIINIGMTIGVVPVIGIPLPFISYGGSSLISFTAMLFIAIKLCAENKVKLNRY